MPRPTVSLPLFCLLLAACASARADMAPGEAPPALAWYALLIVVFALVIGFGLLPGRRDDTDESPKKPVASKKRPRRVPENARHTKESTR